MYGRTVDDFEYRGIKFRWVLSPNKLIYRVYRESELIGTIPASQVRLRHSREAIKALYPICDKWLEQQEAGLRYAEQVKATILNAEPSMIFPIEEAEAAEDAELVPIIETARQEWQGTTSQDDPNTRYEGVHIIRGVGMSRQETLDALAKSNVATTLPFYFPCGEVMNEIAGIDWGSFPLEDVPCPCGNPKHWFVKWSETLQGAPTVEAGGTDETEDIPTALRQNTEGLLKLGRAFEKELAKENERAFPKPKRKGRPRKVTT